MSQERSGDKSRLDAVDLFGRRTARAHAHHNRGVAMRQAGVSAQRAVRFKTDGEALELKSDRGAAAHAQHRGGLALCQSGPTAQQTRGYAPPI